MIGAVIVTIPSLDATGHELGARRRDEAIQAALASVCQRYGDATVQVALAYRRNERGRLIGQPATVIQALGVDLPAWREAVERVVSESLGAAVTARFLGPNQINEVME